MYVYRFKYKTMSEEMVPQEELSPEVVAELVGEVAEPVIIEITETDEEVVEEVPVVVEEEVVVS